MKTDQELQMALAKMLPKNTLMSYELGNYSRMGFHWNGQYDHNHLYPVVKDTEWLHICWMVEETLTLSECGKYNQALADIVIELRLSFKEVGPKVWMFHATWQQRAIALAKVKGIKI